MKFYRVTLSSYTASTIEIVEVEKTTNKFVVFYDGRREAKIGGYWCYFPTLEEANAYIEKYYADIILSKENSLNEAIAAYEATKNKLKNFDDAN